jgi:intein-encoded DNA endonuclease-like protein
MFLQKRNMVKKHLGSNEIIRILELSKQGKSLNYVSQHLGIKKTTAYYWFLKSVGKKVRRPKLDMSNAFDVGEIIGAFAGDGSHRFQRKSYLHTLRFYLSSEEEEYASNLCKVLYRVCGKKANVRRYNSCLIVTLHGKRIYEIICDFLEWNSSGKTYSVRLKQPLDFYSDDFLRGFVRGFVDTDGSVNKKKLQINMGSVSGNLITQISAILNRFEIKNSVYFLAPRGNRKEFFCVEIYGRNTEKFNRLIEFSNPNKKIRLEKHLTRH